MSVGTDTGGMSEDDRLLVAEYALGLLDDAERLAVARRLSAEPAMAAELRLWRHRLSSFDAEFVETTPPNGALNAIERRLFGQPEKSSWWQSLLVWRSFAATAAAVAVLAIGYNLVQPARLAPEELATQLVAAIQSQEGYGVEFIALYDQNSGQVRLAALAGDAIPDRDYELWYIQPDQPAVSMGVIPVDQRTEIPLDDAARAAINPGTIFAVTLEQVGGSPTGVAQGPVVALGTALAI